MTTKIIDSNKCIGCGKCVAVCVTKFLTLVEHENGNKFASPVVRGRCIDCGHCISICPKRAISGTKCITEIDTSDNLLNLMSSKRTVRKYFNDAEIKTDVLDKIILAGQTAPTEKNRKSGRIVLIKENLNHIYQLALDSLVSEVKKVGPINPLYTPTMEMNSNRDNILWNAEYLVVYIGTQSNLTEACISAERMQLMAAHNNVSTAYRGDMKLGINSSVHVRELLNMKPNEEVLVSFVMGISPLKYNLPVIKNNRKVEII